MSSEKSHKKDIAPTKLAKKLISIMSQVERIPKNGYNDFHKYHYATESDVKEGCRQLMADAKVLMTLSIQDIEQVRDDIVRVTSLVTFTDAESGETLSFCVAGDGQDKNDKGIYKAITGSTKYALMSSFLIPTGDDPEKDATDGKKTSAAQKAANAAAAKKKAAAAAKKKAANAGADAAKPNFITPKMKKAVEAIITKTFGDREKFKLWAASRNAIGSKDNKFTLNLLDYAFGHKVIDQTDKALVAYNLWEAETQEAAQASGDDDIYAANIKKWQGLVSAEFLNATVEEMGYENYEKITDLAMRHKLFALLEVEHDRISAELAKELDE